MNELNKKCLGEFPMFPGWLFFEEEPNPGIITIYAYGPAQRVFQATSPSREASITKVLKKILAGYQ